MVRAKSDRSRVVSKTEGVLLDDRKLWKMVRDPIYAGINVEKWTKHQPVKCMFDGLVSVDLFNRANKGKRTIIEMPGNKIAISDSVAQRNATPQGTRNNDFAFKHYIIALSAINRCLVAPHVVRPVNSTRTTTAISEAISSGSAKKI